jgi:SAM-dependent methyltransferase
MPFPDAYFDLVVGDCSLNALAHIADYGEVLREIARVSRPAAPLVTRFFMQAKPRLTIANLPKDAAGRFAGWSPLGRSLLIPIAASDDDGSLCISDIPRKIAERWGELDEFLLAVGQPPEDRALLAEIYHFEQPLNFPSKEGILEELKPWYRDISFEYPGYDCGAFCPIVRCLP